MLAPVCPVDQLITPVQFVAVKVILSFAHAVVFVAARVGAFGRTPRVIVIVFEIPLSQPPTLQVAV